MKNKEVDVLPVGDLSQESAFIFFGGGNATQVGFRYVPFMRFYNINPVLVVHLIEV